MELSEFIANNSILSGVFIALIVMWLTHEFQRRGRRFNEVSPTEAVSLINKEKAVVLDVRPASDFKNGHLTNAINIPFQSLSEQSKKISKYKNKPLIVYCKSGNFSAQACKKLEKEGFETIHNLRGGVMAWERDNLILIK